MSVSGISNSLSTLPAISNGLSTVGSNNPSVQNNLHQFQQEFQQLGSDLQSGNLSAAHQDYVSLHTLAGEGADVSSGPSTPSSNPLVQAFNQLGQDLAVREYFRGAAGLRHPEAGLPEASTRNTTIFATTFITACRRRQQGPASPVGPATPADPGGLASSGLLSTGLSTAQTAYNSLLQGLQDFGSAALNPGSAALVWLERHLGERLVGREPARSSTSAPQLALQSAPAQGGSELARASGGSERRMMLPPCNSGLPAAAKSRSANSW